MIPLQFKKYLILLFLFSNLIFSQKKNKFNIIGNRYIDTKTYIESLEKLNEITFAKVEKNLTKLLNDRGFYNFKLNEIKTDSLKLPNKIEYNIFLNEGEASFLTKINVEAETKDDSLKTKKILLSLLDRPFIKKELESSISNILSYYENNGYPFAKVKVKSIIFDNTKGQNEVQIFLKLLKNNLTGIDEIKITGNNKTNDKVILNNLNLKRGEVYSQKKIDEISSRLNRLRFFNNIKEPKYYLSSKNKGVLEIELEERNTNSFDGLIGYVPSRNNNDGHLTGFIKINLRNLFGTGRAVSINWKQEDKLSQEMFLKYLEPYLFNYPLNLNFEFFQRRQDSSFVKRIIGGSLEFLADKNISGSLILESETIIPSVDVENIFQSSSFNTGLKIKLDYRDNFYFPKSGVLFETEYKFKKKKINPDKTLPNYIGTNLEYHNYELDFSLYYSLFTRQVAAVGLHAKEILGDYFDASDFYRLGGTNTLRGFRENQFLGNRILWSNIEYRFLLSPTSFIFSFYDIGYFLIKADKFNEVERKSNINTGFGLGISLNTAMGILSVSYAFTKGTSLTSGLLHIGIRNDF
ncbi:MAG: hypothetical protein CR986_07705 [Ignavibacteriae bacterium]|nr:MAG: hypothetical protein CR986_07705 [Ignavibacteriota bacterium]